MKSRALSFSFALGAAAFLVAPTASAASVSITGISPSTSVLPGQTVTFYAAAAGFTDAKYSVSSGPGTIDAYGDYSWTPSAADAGGQDVTVSVSDSTSASASATIHLYVIPSTLTIANLSPSGTAYTREPVTFSVQTPGFTAPVFYYLRDSYAGSSISSANIDTSGNFSWTPVANEQGTHVITISVNDAYGHSASAQQSVTVASPSVQITNLAPGSSVVFGTPLTFSVTATGLSNPSFSVSDSLALNSTVVASDTDANGNFSWTPAARDVGTHVLTLTGTDSYGNTAIAKTSIFVLASAQGVSQAMNPGSSSGNPTPASGSQPTGLAQGSTHDGYVFTTYLQIGSHGNAVTELQKHLAIDGFFSGSATGYFGAMTAGAVKKFQAAHGISQTGTIGPMTRKALNAE